MKIDKISLKNLKGVTKDYDLSGSNLIYGDNGTGKTAILDSLRLACLGYHPKLGKTGSKIFTLSSSNEMRASVRFTDSQVCEFYASYNGNSISKNWDSCEIEDSFKIQLDPNIFFSTTKDEKTQKIFALLSKQEKANLKQRIVAEINATDSDKTDLEIEIISNFAKCVEKIIEEEDSPSVALSNIQEKCKEFVSEARQNLDRVKKSIENHASNTDFSSALLKNEEFYLNLKDEINNKLFKLEDEKKQREAIVNKISTDKEEFNDLEEAIKKSSSDHKEKQILKEHEELEKAFNKEYKILQNDVLKLRKELDNANEVNELAKDSSYEIFCQKIDNGNYVLELEVLKDQDGVSNTIWKASPFGISEKAKELTHKEYELKSLKDAFESESKMLLYKYETEKEKKLSVDSYKLESLKKQIKENQAELETFRNWKTIDKEIEGISEEQDRINQTLKKVRELSYQKKNGLKLKEQSFEFDTELKLLKNIQKSIKELTEKISKSTLSKLLDPMNLFASAIGLPDYCIIDGKIGYTQAGRIIDYNSFSGSEMAIFKVAITVALAINGGTKIAIIDELGRFDDTRKRATLLALIKFVDTGVLDQFICVDVISPISIDNINLITTNGSR